MCHATVHLRNKSIERDFQRFVDSVEEAVELFEETVELLRRVVGPVPARGLRIKITGERTEKNMPHILIYKLSWDAPAATADVDKQILSSVVNGGEPSTLEFAKDVASVEGLEYVKDSAVSLSLVNMDGSGNASEPSTLDFVATDKIAPAGAAGLRLESTGERVDPD